MSSLLIVTVDNQSAKGIIQKPEFHFWTKYIRRIYFIVRIYIKNNILGFPNIMLEYHLEDEFTDPRQEPD